MEIIIADLPNNVVCFETEVKGVKYLFVNIKYKNGKEKKQ